MIKRFAHPYLALRISIQFSHRIFSIVEKSLPKRKRKKKRNRFAPLPRRTEPIDASIIQHKKKESRNEGTISCPLIRKHSGSRRLLAGAWRRNEGNEPLSPFCTLVTDTTVWRNAFLRGRRGLVSPLPAITALSREFQYRGGAFNDEIRFPHSASFTMVIYARGSRSPKTPTLTLFPVYHYYRKRNDRERLRALRN